MFVVVIVESAVFVDEISPAGLVRQTIALPTRAFGSQHACTLNADQWAIEGLPSTSTDGKVFMFGKLALNYDTTSFSFYNANYSGCYDASAGTSTQFSGRTIARIWADGHWDTSLNFTSAYTFPNVFSSVV